MAEISGMGGSGGSGWTPSGTTHFSRRYRSGRYHVGPKVRSNAMAYALGSLMIGPLLLGPMGITRGAPARSMGLRYAGSVSRYRTGTFAMGTSLARRRVGAATVGGRVVVVQRYVLPLGPGIAFKYAHSLTQGPSVRDSRTGGSSRRRRFEYEYAYKF